MSINERIPGKTPEERLLTRITDLERQVATMQRANAAGIQRAFDQDGTEYSTSSGSYVAPPTGPQISVTIPSLDSLVFVEWNTLAKKSGTAQANLGVVVHADPLTSFLFVDGIHWTNSTVYGTHQPLYTPYNAANNGSLQPGHKATTMLTGQLIQQTGVTIPGTAVFEFYQSAVSGSGLAYTKDRNLRVVVI